MLLDFYIFEHALAKSLIMKQLLYRMMFEAISIQIIYIQTYQKYHQVFQERVVNML